VEYSDLDPTLKSWAAKHGLQWLTLHRDDECRAATIVDDAGNTYGLSASPDFSAAELVLVRVALRSKAGESKIARASRTLNFRQSVPLNQLPAALDAVWRRVHEWIVETGNTRTPA
jgi:hypothetical protein